MFVCDFGHLCRGRRDTSGHSDCGILSNLGESFSCLEADTTSAANQTALQ